MLSLGATESESLSSSSICFCVAFREPALLEATISSRQVAWLEPTPLMGSGMPRGPSVEVAVTWLGLLPAADPLWLARRRPAAFAALRCEPADDEDEPPASPPDGCGATWMVVVTTLRPVRDWVTCWATESGATTDGCRDAACDAGTGRTVDAEAREPAWLGATWLRGTAAET